MTARVGRRATGEAFRVRASDVCSECGSPIEGWIAFNLRSRVVGSGGFLVCANGLVCDECLETRGVPVSRASCAPPSTSPE
jgi:hypothetical protein